MKHITHATYLDFRLTFANKFRAAIRPVAEDIGGTNDEILNRIVLALSYDTRSEFFPFRLEAL